MVSAPAIHSASDQVTRIGFSVCESLCAFSLVGFRSQHEIKDAHPSSIKPWIILKTSHWHIDAIHVKQYDPMIATHCFIMFRSVTGRLCMILQKHVLNSDQSEENDIEETMRAGMLGEMREIRGKLREKLDSVRDQLKQSSVNEVSWSVSEVTLHWPQTVVKNTAGRKLLTRQTSYVFATTYEQAFTMPDG